MVTFLGIFSAFFYTCFIGLAWPSRTEVSFPIQVLGAIGKSFWISWFLVVFMYFSQTIIPFWLVFSIWLVFYLWFRRDRSVQTIPAPDLLFIGGMALVIIIFAVWVYFTSQYTLIFTKGDAVASWNKWAVELSKNNYMPWDTAYPILFPAIWSLIYKAQNHEFIWFFAKASLFILPILIGFSVLTLFQTKRFLAALISGIFGGYFFLFAFPDRMLGGYMDIPVVVMIIVTTTLLIVVAEMLERGEKKEILLEVLMVAAIFAGLASVTKQAGSVLVVVILLVMVMLRIRKNISWQEFIVMITIILLPAITYLIMYWSVETELTGNLPILIDLTEKVRKMMVPNGTIYDSAYLLLSRKVGDFSIVIMFLLGFLNLVNIKKPSAQLGLLYLIAASLGFLLYVNCCAYNEKNGWWIYGFLFPAMLLVLPFNLDLVRFSKGFLRKIPVINTQFLGERLIVSVLFFSILSGLIVSSAKLQRMHEGYQWLMPIKEARPVLKILSLKMDSLPKGWIIISPHQEIRWLPNFKSHYRLCVYYQSDCVRKEMKKTATTFLLVNTKNKYYQYVDLAPLLPNNKLIEENGYVKLYGPLKFSDLKPKK